MPKAPVSVVIPALNAERFIRETIKSVLAQTLAVSELIVVNNGCTDRTRQVALEAGATVIDEGKRGVSAALNAGILASSQEWVAVLGADDLWEPDKTEWQWRAVESCPDAGMVGCDHTLLYSDPAPEQAASGGRGRRRGRWEGRADKVAAGDGCVYFPKPTAEFCARFLPLASGVMLRRDVFQAVGLFDEGLSHNEDVEFFIRVLARYPLAVIERPLVRYRRHGGNMSKDLEGMWSSVLATNHKMAKHPEMYPEGVARAHLDFIKSHFAVFERAIAERRGRP